MLSDLFLVWLAAAMCFVNALDRPDQQRVWLSGLWFAVALMAVMGVTG